VVENAFKYCSTDAESDSWIQIHLKACRGNLQLVTANTYLPEQRPATTGGIGLQNLQKRLSNAYPAQHHFQIEDDPPVYTVTIELRHL
jgi:LytS/YehU family sensor histidine kinase